MILVDTSVLIDVLKGDRDWQQWSDTAIDRASTEDSLCINEIVYAELSIGYDSVEDLDQALAALRLKLSHIPRIGLFLAARAHLQYRRHGGTKLGVLSDFFIGAHAVAEDAKLITRDPGRIRTYFPTIDIITP